MSIYFKEPAVPVNNQPQSTEENSTEKYDASKKNAIEKLKTLLSDGEIEGYKKLSSKFYFSEDERSEIIAEALLTCLAFKEADTITKINTILPKNYSATLKRKIHENELEELKRMGLNI